MPAREDAREGEVEGFEEALFEEVVVFVGVGDEDPAGEDGGSGFLAEEFVVFEDVLGQHAFHHPGRVRAVQREKCDVEKDERVFFLRFFGRAEFRW